MNFELSLVQARIGIVCSWIAFVICAMIASSTDNVIAWVLTFVSIGVMFFFYWFYRCPSCGRCLGRHHWFIEYCPYCGNYL